MFSFPLSFLKDLCLLVIFAVSATAQSSEWQKEFQNKTSNLTIIDKEIAVMEYNYRFGLISIKRYP
ncbi:MAG: hypothetical protein IPN79_06235 [Saprospiraceae bacterium]|nr:hypothetical protein [Saprospiraceae bacterium]